MYQTLTGSDFDIGEERTEGLFQTVPEETVLMDLPESPHTDLQFTENDTGLPDNLKTGIETMSGYSMDDVKVHYHSDKPAKMGAAAYTQGTDIYVSSGQEHCLPHESWHVVQQFQGRVTPTRYQNGIGVNESESLEQEADLMGKKALSFRPPVQQKSVDTSLQKTTVSGMPPCQKVSNTIEDSNEAMEQIKQAFSDNGWILDNDEEVFSDILSLRWEMSSFKQLVKQILSIVNNSETNMNVQTGDRTVIAVRHINGSVPIKVIWTQTGNSVHILGVYEHHNDAQHYRIICGKGPKNLAITSKDVTKSAKPKPEIPKTKKTMPPRKKRH